MEDKKLLRSLLNKVNKVTAPYRHGNDVSDKALTELVDRQIEVESHLSGSSLLKRAVKVMVAHLNDITGYQNSACHNMDEMKEIIRDYDLRDL